MARPQKIGLDYFPLDVDIDQDDKVAIIEAQHGILGFSVVIKLLMKIYSEGYYYDWTEKEQILFSKRVNVDISKVNVIINDCIKWGMFNDELFNKYQILTSKGIQVRYFEAVKRRQKVEIAKEFLLLDSKTAKNYINLVIVSINEDEDTVQEVNVDINKQGEEVNVDINPQSKVKKSKVKNIKEDKNKEDKTKEDNRTTDTGRSSCQSTDTGVDNSKSLSIIANAFQSDGFGSINMTVKNILVDLLDHYPTEWILEAMKIAVESNKRSLRYVKGILENWNREGGMKLGGNKDGANRTSTEQNVDEYAGLGFTYEDVQEM